MESYFKIRSDRKHILLAGEWENDNLKIYFPNHKSDQIGLNKDEANTNDASVCLLYVLPSYLFVFPSILLIETNYSRER